MKKKLIKKGKIIFVERCDGKYISPTKIGKQLNSSWHISKCLRKQGVASSILSHFNLKNKVATNFLRCISSNPVDVAQQIKRLNCNTIIISSWIELLCELGNYKKRKILVFRGMRNLDNVKKYKKQINHYAFKIVAVSNTQARVLIEAGLKRNKILVIPNGIDFKIFRARQGKRILRSLVYIGALAKEKGVDILLDAFMLLHKKYPDTRLVICGSEKIYGIKNHEFSKKIKTISGIKFKGLISQQKIAKILSNTSYCIVPTNPNLIFETFSKATHEAQLMGCLPIVSTSGCLPEVVQDNKNGFIFKMYSSDGLYKKLLEIFKKDRIKIDKIRKMTVSMARSRWLSWNEVAFKFLEILN